MLISEVDLPSVDGVTIRRPLRNREELTADSNGCEARKWTSSVARTQQHQQGGTESKCMGLRGRLLRGPLEEVTAVIFSCQMGHAYAYGLLTESPIVKQAIGKRSTSSRSPKGTTESGGLYLDLPNGSGRTDSDQFEIGKFNPIRIWFDLNLLNPNPIQIFIYNEMHGKNVTRPVFLIRTRPEF